MKTKTKDPQTCPKHGFIGTAIIAFEAITDEGRKNRLDSKGSFCMHCFIEHLKKAGITEVELAEETVESIPINDRIEIETKGGK